MTAFRLVRNGARGQLHAAVQGRGGLRAACGRPIPATATVWRSGRMIAALWGADDARRCLDCSSMTGAGPRQAAGRPLR